MATDKTTIFNQGIKQFLRPSTVTSVSWSSYKMFVANQYNIFSTAGGTPSSNAQMSVDDTDSTNVAFIRIYDTQLNGTNNGTFFNDLAPGSQIRILQTGVGSSADEYYNVLYGANDFGSYVEYQVIWASGNGGTFDAVYTDVVYVYSDYEYELTQGYNLLTVTNTATSNPGGSSFRMKMPSSMEAGEELIVEILAGGGTTSNIIPTYIYNLNTSGTPSDINSIYVPNGTSTNALLTLDSNDRAIMKFLSWYNSSTQNGLIPLGALQVING